MTQTSGASSEEQSTLREGMRALGFAENLLASAVSVFKTVEMAQKWIRVTEGMAHRGGVMFEIAISKIQPEDYARLREAGVTATVALQLPKHLASAGVTVDQIALWYSANLGPRLSDLLPHLRSGLSFDELMSVVGNRPTSTDIRPSEAVDELLELLDKGLTVDELREHTAAGWNLHQIHTWRKAGVPVIEWPAWRALDISADIAKTYVRNGVSAAVAAEWTHSGFGAPDAVASMRGGLSLETAEEWAAIGLRGGDAVTFSERRVPVADALEWIQTGMSASDAAVFIDRGLSLSSAREWVQSGMSASDAGVFIDRGLSLSSAGEWVQSGMSASDAGVFIDRGLSLSSAREWVQTGLDTWTAMDFLDKGVSATEAAGLDKRRIDPDQLTRTDDGYEIDFLHPWQEDPVERLPEVVEAGHIGFVLWSTVAGGDWTAYDISFVWDGKRRADWYQDISMVGNDLSPASSSPLRGTAEWDDGRGVFLTFERSEISDEGSAWLSDAAPTRNNPDTDDGAHDPRQWIRFGEEILNWIYRTF